MEVSKADFARMAGVSKAAISKKAKNNRLIINNAGFIDTDNPINRMYLDKHQQNQKNNLFPSSLPLQPQYPGAPSATGATYASTAPSAPGATFAHTAPSAPGATFAPTAPSAPSNNPAHPTARATATATAHPNNPRPAGYTTPASNPRPANNAAYTNNQQTAAGYANDANIMLNMTLRELIQNYNGLDGIEKYAKILKDLLAADERAQRIQERRQLQIPKDFVISRLFGYLNQQNNRLLDLPEAMADQVIALAQTGAAQTTQTQNTENPNSQTIEQLATLALNAAPTVPPAPTAPTQPQAQPNEPLQPAQTTVTLNDTRQKIVNYLRDNITRCIGGAKQTIIDELKTLQAKYANEDDTQNQLQEIYEAINET